MKKYLFIVIVLLLLPSSVLARCNDADKVRLNKLATNVSFTYNYVESNNDISFNVTITNLDKDLMVYDKYNDAEYKNKNEITIKGYKANTIARFYIYAKDDTCISSSINTNTISFPSYNPYYKDKLCSQAPNYVYCKKWVNNPYKYEEFSKNILKYIEEQRQNTIEEEIPEPTEKGIFDYIGEFYVRFYYIILPLIIISCFVGMYYLNKKNQLV